MKIESLSQLNKLLTLCRKQGVNIIKIDNIEIVLEGKPDVPVQHTNVSKSAVVPTTYAPGGITEDTQILTPDALTEEQLLFYSTGTEQ